MIAINLFFVFVLIFLTYALLKSTFAIAPFVPMEKKDLGKINELAGLKDGQKFCELGSGDGRVCGYIAKKNPKSKSVGIEMLLPVFLWSKLKNKLFSKTDNLELIFGDALKYDLSDCDVVYTYALMTTINTHMIEKFEKELKKGAKIISYAFSMKKWKGPSYEYESAGKRVKIFVYEK